MHDHPRRPLRLDLIDPGTALLDVAGEFLVAREAEHSLLLGLAGTMRDRPFAFPDPYLAVVHDDAGIQLVVLWARPRDLMLSMAGRLEAVDLAAAAVMAQATQPSGVVGPAHVARRFVKAWGALGGPAAVLSLRTRTYRLDEVVSPAVPPPGAPRTATRVDLGLIAAWLAAFTAEALPHEPAVEDPRSVLAGWLDDPGRTIWLWTINRAPVSMAVAGSRTPHGRRIGLVYTPPEHRRRGYAGALVAAASQAELSAGRRACFLDTDLANPTSNGIYERIGYRAVIDGARYGLTGVRP